MKITRAMNAWEPELRAYYHGLRDANKKAYALDWIAYRLNDKLLPDHEHGLSNMDAHAVRMRVDAILEGGAKS